MAGKKKVTAIIPAYNEAARISRVINSLKTSKLIDEIIVVDDGSKDGTFEIAKKIKKIKCLRIEKNKGKGKAIGLGIRSTNAEIIFLCDADLKRFSGEMADKIISPVLNNETKLSMGIRKLRRNKIMMKLNLKIEFLLLSGQRAFTRDIWFKMPEYYKKGFRIELGMNYLVKKKFGGSNLLMLNYGQYIKESKMGILKGELQRWKMNANVVQAFLRFQCYDRFILK
ncbi:MAG: glycosyltransferase family 2 protein [Nanoarchaeota archaeon]